MLSVQSRLLNENVENTKIPKEPLDDMSVSQQQRVAKFHKTKFGQKLLLILNQKLYPEIWEPGRVPTDHEGRVRDLVKFYNIGKNEITL